jgi:catechol 2,3-dioxygenase-like lactoylglutathione lyase family enzyme
VANPDMVGMTVRDMAASLKFYRLLGLDIPPGVESEPHVEYVTAGGFRLAWDTEKLIKEIYLEWTTPVGQRLTLAFKCENAAEVDSLYERVVQNGYHGHKAPWDAFWGQRYAIVVDPDGNHVDLFAQLG